MKSVIIYSDGGCRGNPGIGGWGALLFHGKTEKSLSGHALNTTNNRMELTAAIAALECLKEPCEVKVVTDSKYVCQGALEWLPNWKAKNWKTANKNPVKNQDLWEKIDNQLNIHKVSFEWVKGHAGHPENERVDALANAEMDLIAQK